MPPAGPFAMAAPAPVTDPGVQCSASEVPPPGTKLRVRSGEPPLRLVSSAKGATGRSSGTVTSATSDARVGRHDRGGLELAARADHDDAPDAAQEVGGRGDQTSLGHGDADERHRARGPVVTCSSTMERPAAWAAAGTAFCGPARVVGRLVVDVRRGALERALRGRGEQHDDPGDDGHDGADADEDHDRPAVGMALRGVQEQWRLGARGATSLGWRHSRSSGSIHPRSGAIGAVRTGFRRPRRGPARPPRAPRACRSPGRRYRERPWKCRRGMARPYHVAPWRATWQSTLAPPTRWSTPRGRASC